MKLHPPTSVVSSLTPEHDALADCLRSMRMEIGWWRLATVVCVVALMVTVAIRHPAVFMAAFALVLLLGLVLGGALHSMYRGDAEMGVADSTGRTTTH